MEAISTAADEDADGGMPWPEGGVGALIDGFLDFVSDHGQHHMGADKLVWAARDEVRLMAATIRALWAENQKLHETFAHLEWDDMGDVRGRKECHCCHVFEEDGHRDGCVFKVKR